MNSIDSISDEKWINYIEENSTKGRNIVKFIFLWLRYNAYYNKFELNDRCGAIKIAQDTKAQHIYNQFKTQALNEFSKIPKENGCDSRMGIYKPNNVDLDVQYNDSNKDLKDFLKTVYKIRCNLFHGTKGVPTDTNVQLILWAYKHLNNLLNHLNGITRF